MQQATECCPGSGPDAVEPTAVLRLVGADLEAESLLQRAREEAAHRVRLPAGGLHDLLDRRATRPLQHSDHLRLLGVIALAPCWLSACSDRLLLGPDGLAAGLGELQGQGLSIVVCTPDVLARCGGHFLDGAARQ